MPAPLNPNLWACVLHDEDGVPISATNPLPTTGGGGGGGGIITDVIQQQNIETIAPLAGGATFNGAPRNCLTFESFGISAYAEAAAGSLDVTVLVENSSDGGVTFREVDTVKLVAGVGESRTLNRVYSVTRQHYRVSIINNDAVNALAATELISMLKPI